MPRKKTLMEPKRVTMIFHASSYQKMAEFYPSVGAQAAIRELVHSHVSKLEAGIRSEVSELVKNLDLEGDNV